MAGSVLWCSSVWDYLSHYERAYDLRGGGAGTESMLAGGLEVYLIAKYVRLRVLVSSLPSGCSQALHAALFNPVQQNLIATSDYEV